MKPVTLRKIPPVLARSIRHRAEHKRISLNRAVLELLEEAVGAPKRPKQPVVHQDLDGLFGAWSAPEAAAFQKSLSHQRTIDPELWK